MLGMAIRIAQRMGIHNESSYTKCTAFEGEMRRRLWWALVIFDNRICEMSDYKTASLTPTWDCKTPTNVNDYDLRPEMKTMPEADDKPTEAIFAIMRSELGEFLRHSPFHLEFTNPALKAIAKIAEHRPIGDGNSQQSSDLIALDQNMEDKYLAFCNPENPLHFVTIWSTRAYLAKNYLLDHYSRYLKSPIPQTDDQRDTAISHALSLIECDTRIQTSPLTKGFLWLTHFYFPFLGYIHIVQDLKRRPLQRHAERAWHVMSENYEVRFMNERQRDNAFSKFMNERQRDNAFSKVFSPVVLQAWEACEAARNQSPKPLEPTPRMVTQVKSKVTQQQNSSDMQGSGMEYTYGGTANMMNMNDFPMPLPMDFDGFGLPYGMQGHDAASLSAGLFDTFGQLPTNVDLSQLDWTKLDWNPLQS